MPISLPERLSFINVLSFQTPGLQTGGYHASGKPRLRKRRYRADLVLSFYRSISHAVRRIKASDGGKFSSLVSSFSHSSFGPSAVLTHRIVLSGDYHHRSESGIFSVHSERKCR